MIYERGYLVTTTTIIVHETKDCKKELLSFNFSKKVTRAKKFALPCPVPCSRRPAGQSGQGEKKTFALQYRAGQYRSPGQQGSPALMTVSEQDQIERIKLLRTDIEIWLDLGSSRMETLQDLFGKKGICCIPNKTFSVQ